MTRLTSRIQAIQPSATFAIKARARELAAAGVDVVDLSTGEPDGDPPAEVAEAAIAAIRAGQNGYGPVCGTSELRHVIADSYQAKGLEVTSANVLVTFGGKQALNHLANALFGPGDEVILLSPYWVSYPAQVKLTGARPVLVPADSTAGFQPDPDAIEAAITSRTRAILVNSPSNPTGCVAERGRLEAIDRLAARRGIAVISDEIYDAMTYGEAEAICYPSLNDVALRRTMVVNAVSKTYAMTGWRVGWMLASTQVVDACAKLHGHSTSGVSLINQAAAVAALRSSSDYVEPVKAALVRRRDLMVAGLDAIEGVSVGPVPQGAFYVFPRVDGLFGRKTPRGRILKCGFDVADYLISEGGLGVVPGEAFGEPRCIRLSYALALPVVEEGVARAAAALSKLN